LQPSAEECGLKIWQLADVIAYQIRPINWQVFSWMAVALQGCEYEGMLTESLSKQATALAEMRKKKQSDAKAAADALHNKPGGSRSKQTAIRAAWATGRYSSRDECAEQECAHLNMSYSAARKALRNIAKPT
jgi:hypothetical protein